MEHQDHSNGNGAPKHQVSSTTTSSTTTTSLPSFRVYVDMGTEQFANGPVVYTSSNDDEKKTCIDSLSDDAHYRFSCRCGCGAEFAGFGRDIKASGKIGRAPLDSVNLTSNGSAQVTLTPNTVVVTQPGHGLVMDDQAADKIEIKGEPKKLNAKWSLEHTADLASQYGVEINSNREEAAEKTRPFVSDRYLQKALWGISDDEIDDYRKNRPDPLEAKGVKLSERQPPAIGDLVYSLATGEGPYSLLEYQQHEVALDDGGTTKLLCGLCRTAGSRYKIIPLADLALHWAGRPVVQVKRRWVAPALMVLASSLIGSLAALAYFAF